MHRLYLSCFGALEITLDGHTPKGLDTDKTRALWVYLAVESGRPHRREHLAGLLWSDQPEQRAMHSLRQALSILRKALGDSVTEERGSQQPFLQVNPDTVQINPQADVWVDVQAFRESFTAAQRFLEHSRALSRLNLSQLEQAVAIYRGPFLDQFFLSDSALFEEWMLVQREALNLQAVEALSMLGEVHERRGDLAQARKLASRLVELVPWNETAHAWLMRLHAQDGNWSAAEAQYQALRRYLGEQMAVEPATETQSLAETIRQACLQGALLPPRFPVPAYNLGAPIATPFVGRQAELRQLSAWLADASTRLVTLLGQGGIGKTRLSRRLARQQLGLYAQGVFFISLGGLDEPAHLAAAVADALGFQFYQPDRQAGQLVDYLRSREMLLVLDNFETALPGEGQGDSAGCEALDLVVEILEQAPRVQMLVTSRLPLNLRMERVLLLEGLAYPGEAIELFAQIAQRVAPAFMLDQEMEAVDNICRILEGSPLAIELAAAWRAQMDCQEIAARVASSLDFLRTTMRDVPPRHRSLRAVFTQSWQLLQPPEQQALAVLSVFAGTFSGQAASRALGVSPRQLHTLVGLSWARSLGEERFELHSLVRQFAAELLAADPVAENRIRSQHAETFRQFVAQRSVTLISSEQLEALQEMEIEFGNLHAAWNTLVEQRRAADLGSCAEAIYHFFNIKSRFIEGIDWLKQAALALEDLPEARVERGKLLACLGALSYRISNHELTRQALSEASECLAGTGQERWLAFCRITQGGQALREKAHELALQYAQESLRLYRQVEEVWGEAYARYLQGWIFSRMGDEAQAELALLESVRLGRQTGDARRLVMPLNVLADLACIRGEYDQAMIYFEEALAISQVLEDRYHTAMLLNNLASVYQDRQEYPAEQRCLEESARLCREIGDRVGEAIAQNGLGEMFVFLGRFQEGYQVSLQALELARQAENEDAISYCLKNLGEAAAGLEDPGLAERHFFQSLRLAWDTRQTYLQGRLLVDLAALWLAQGRKEPIVEMLQAAAAHQAVEVEMRQRARQLLAQLGEAETAPAPVSLEEMIERLLAEE